MPASKEEKLLDVPAAKEEPITPRDLLFLAKCILAGVALLFCLGAITEFCRPGSNIFEACKTILPPIATLVIGFYFGKGV